MIKSYLQIARDPAQGKMRYTCCAEHVLAYILIRIGIDKRAPRGRCSIYTEETRLGGGRRTDSFGNAKSR